MHILFWKVSLFYHIPEPESIAPAIKIGFEECGRMRQKQNPELAGLGDYNTTAITSGVLIFLLIINHQL